MPCQFGRNSGRVAVDTTGTEIGWADQQAARDAHEAVLLARVAIGGDGGEALRALHGRYAGPVSALGLRQLGEFGLAEELVQETFLRLWRSAGSFDPSRGSVRTFVFTLARRAAVDLLRRRAMRPLDLLADAGVAEGVVVGMLAAWGLATLEDARRIRRTEDAEGRDYFAACRRPTSVGDRLVWVPRKG